MVPQIYHTKELKAAINDHIEEGCKSYYDINEADREKLAVYCMNALKEDADVFITHTDSLDKLVCQMKRFLLTGKIDVAMDMARTLCDSAVKKSEEILPDLFDELYGYYVSEKNTLAGMRKTTCDQTGETRYVK